MQPLDESTYNLARQTILRGRVQGVSAITALHSAGLILGPDLANQIRQQTLISVTERLACVRLRDLLGPQYAKHGATPAEVRAATVQWLEQLAELARRGEFR